MVIFYSKESLSEKLKEIKSRGWILNTRSGNDGAVGNILEDLLGLKASTIINKAKIKSLV